MSKKVWVIVSYDFGQDYDGYKEEPIYIKAIFSTRKAARGSCKFIVGHIREFVLDPVVPSSLDAGLKEYFEVFEKDKKSKRK
jgi:hypothetical protein